VGGNGEEGETKIEKKGGGVGRRGGEVGGEKEKEKEDEEEEKK
jgi:hypothetical protein